MTRTPSNVDISRIDLNLLRLCTTLLETRNVTLAAERLGVTQPTLSYGLAKLRKRFNDRLFLRGPQGMLPTPLGEQLAREFAQALGQIDRAVESAQHFEPSDTHRRFRVAMSDIGGLYFVPPLLMQLQQEAPFAELEVKQVTLDQVVDGLASGASAFTIWSRNHSTGGLFSWRVCQCTLTSKSGSSTGSSTLASPPKLSNTRATRDGRVTSRSLCATKPGSTVK